MRVSRGKFVQNFKVNLNISSLVDAVVEAFESEFEDVEIELDELDDCDLVFAGSYEGYYEYFYSPQTLYEPEERIIERPRIEDIENSLEEEIIKKLAEKLSDVLVSFYEDEDDADYR